MKRNSTYFYPHHYISCILLLFIIFCTASCKKFVQIPEPQTELTQSLVFSSDATATAAISGIYNQMCQSSNWAGGSNNSIGYLTALYADDLRTFSQPNPGVNSSAFYFNTLVPSDSYVTNVWGGCYNVIYQANRIIEALQTSKGVSEATKRQLTGESLFLRAFTHFYLVNLYGDVPYIATTDYRINTKVSRTSTEEVYQHIISDLKAAQADLSDAYPNTGQRVRPNKAAATALLARAYLFHRDWADAEAQATVLISNTNQYELLSDLNKVFLKNSREAIWQLIPPAANLATNEADFLILLTTPTDRQAITNTLWSSFENQDKRQTSWADTLTVGNSSWYFPFKYKEKPFNGTGAEYSMVLRLAEQYLIRAEARIKLNKLSEAIADINTIRHRAGLSNATATTADLLFAEIRQQRREELFTEWGHRFFDLKRWGLLDQTLSSKSNWTTNAKDWPIPQSERNVNPMLSQNPGY